MEYLDENTDTEQLNNGLHKFKYIRDHRGPYTSSDPEYLRSSYNLLIEWETGEMTRDPGVLSRSCFLAQIAQV